MKGIEKIILWILSIFMLLSSAVIKPFSIFNFFSFATQDEASPKV